MPHCPGSILGHCPTPRAHFPKGKKFLRPTSSSHPCRPVSSDARRAPYPALSPLPSTAPPSTKRATSVAASAGSSWFPPHTLSADAPARPQGARGPRSVGQNSMLKTSRVRKAHPCDLSSRVGDTPSSTPPLTIPPPPRVNVLGIWRGAPPYRTEAPLPGRTWAGAASHSAVSPSFPRAWGQASLLHHPRCLPPSHVSALPSLPRN